MFCGYLIARENESPHLPDLEIISENVFKQVQFIMDQRSAKDDYLQADKTDKALQRISVRNRLRQRLQEIPQGIYDGILITRYIKKPSQLCEGYRHGNQFSKIINSEMVILTSSATKNRSNSANFVTEIICLY